MKWLLALLIACLIATAVIFAASPRTSGTNPHSEQYQLHIVDNSVVVFDPNTADAWVLSAKDKRWLRLPNPRFGPQLMPSPSGPLEFPAGSNIQDIMNGLSLTNSP
jgi:hypothetical protein